jgi:maleylacetoacetate isomerase/maleylpyruvate isomerase
LSAPASSAAPVTFYGNWRSSSSQRVACALNLKGIAYDYRPVNLDAREQEGEAFRAVHPGGQVPVLIVGDFVATQSLAILESLDELFPESAVKLLPSDPHLRLRAREIAEYVNSMMQPFQLPRQVRARMVRAFDLEKHPLGVDAACRAFTKDHLLHTVAELDRLVARTAGRFAIGDSPSLADCLVFPQLNAAVPFGIDLNGFAALSRVYESCSATPAFRNAHPTAFPDAPKEGAGASTSAAAGAGASAANAAASAALQGVIDATMDYKEPDAETSRYLLSVVNRPIPGIETVRAEAFRRFGPLATKISAMDVCFFLRSLAELMQAKRVVEIGVFTGSSSLALLAGMPADGKLIGFDVSADYTSVARAAWEAAGFSSRVELRLEDSLVGVKKLAAEPGMLGTIDLAYVDGLNTQYQQNHEDLLPLMRPGGVIVYDNVLWKGQVAKGTGGDAQTVHLRELNANLKNDPRVASSVVRLGDGLAIAVKT